MILASYLVLASGVLPANQPTPSCVQFEWAASPLGGDRAGLLIPVEVNGTNLRFHLDFGAGSSIRYVKDTVADRAAPGGDDIRLPGSAPIRNTLKRFPAFLPYDGSLALDLLQSKIVLIDYPQQRFCTMDEATLAREFGNRVSWSEASLRERHLFVPLQVGGLTLAEMYFDPGDPLVGIGSDFADWQRLTGLERGAAAPESVRVRLPDGPIWVYGAPTAGALQIAGVDLGRPKAFSGGPGQNFYTRLPFRAKGLLGNRAVMQRAVVLDLRTPARFGIVR